MKLPPLPRRMADAWDLGFAEGLRGRVNSVSAHAGRVVVGGENVHQIDAGAENWLGRPRPDGVGEVWFVAQEPWSPFRRAILSDEGIAIYMSNKPGGRIAHVAGGKTLDASGLVWGRLRKKSAVLALWDTGEVGFFIPEEEFGANLDLPPMVALASDGEGTVAMLSLDPLQVWVTRDGERYTHSSLDAPEDWWDALPAEFDFPFHLAVAGKAVAYSFGQHGAFVCRDVAKQPFVKCEPLSLAGALAFEGSSPDAALFGATATDAFSSIVRVDVSGNAVRVGDLRATPGPAVPFSEMAWDGSRRMLFAVHPEVGLAVATAPDAKGGKLRAPN